MCIRARPLLQHEIDHGHFEVVHAVDPHFYFLEPKVSIRQKASMKSESHLVDYSFGPSDQNDKVYQSIIYPIIDLCFEGGLSSIFAYGQTGSGKTYTIQGIQTRMASDIFSR